MLKLGLEERRRDLVLDDLDADAVADRLVVVLVRSSKPTPRLEPGLQANVRSG
jgi:hypothetical protein